MDSEKELMDQLRNIVEAEDKRLTQEARDEAVTISKGIFAALDNEFADEENSILLYVASVDNDEALQDLEDKKHIGVAEGDTVEGLRKRLQESEVRAAKAAMCMPPVPKDKLVELLGDQTVVMMLHGWAKPMGLVARIVNEDGSVFKGVSFPNDLAYEWTTPDGKSEYRHATYDQEIPDPDEFGGDENMKLMQILVTAAQQPRELKRHFPDAYDALMDKSIEHMKNELRDKGIDPESLGE
jgi:hypothetical protein